MSFVKRITSNVVLCSDVRLREEIKIACDYELGALQSAMSLVFFIWHEMEVTG